jgi:hypothetical protein
MFFLLILHLAGSLFVLSWDSHMVHIDLDKLLSLLSAVIFFVCEIDPCRMTAGHPLNKLLFYFLISEMEVGLKSQIQRCMKLTVHSNLCYTISMSLLKAERK